MVIPGSIFLHAPRAADNHRNSKDRAAEANRNRGPCCVGMGERVVPARCLWVNYLCAICSGRETDKSKGDSYDFLSQQSWSSLTPSERPHAASFGYKHHTSSPVMKKICWLCFGCNSRGERWQPISTVLSTEPVLKEN